MLLLLRLTKSFCKNNNAVRPISIGSVIRKKLFSSNALNVNTNVIKDVILFKYDNPSFFKKLNIFVICQFGFWTYLSYVALTTLRDAPVQQSSDDSDVVWWRKINLGENKYRNSLTFLCFIIGYGVLAIGWMYTLRSVRYLILHKGGQEVTFVTYTPFMKNRMITVGLNNVSCKETRDAARSQLPIKVKNHYLHYILDMKGEFRNPTLFDHTAGLRRMWNN